MHFVFIGFSNLLGNISCILNSGWINLYTFVYTLQPQYNTVRYNTVLDTTRFKDGSKKCIDYFEKWP